MNTEFKIKQFEKFYHFLMKNAPVGYIPWFFPCDKMGKNPSPEAIIKINPSSRGSWHHEEARLSKEQCIEHIKEGYNLGISAREGDPLIVGDIDEAEFMNQLPEDTLTSTSRKRCGGHFFGWDKDGTAKINLPTDGGEMRSNNQYVLAPGSYVPFNLESEKDKKAFDKLSEEAKNDPLIGYYTVRNAQELKEIGFNELPDFFKEKEKENIQKETEIKQRDEIKSFEGEGKYSELLSLTMKDILGQIPSNKRKGHPLHESDTDANFSLNKEGTLGMCWRHLVSLNPIQYLCVKSGYAKCEDAGTPHKGRGLSKIKGDKKALEIAYKEAVKLGLINKYEGKKSELPHVFLPGTGKLISEFAKEIGGIFEDKQILFFKPSSRDVVEISFIEEKDNEKRYLGFIPLRPERFITLVEKNVTPVIEIFNQRDYSQGHKEKSMSSNVANVTLASSQLQNKLPKINRIFHSPIPIIHEGKLTFPKKGYDERFNCFTPLNSPEIKEMTLEEAKEIIKKLFGEFCFQEDLDYINALAGLLTPFIRGLLPTFSTRTPMFVYTANRERAGKDYCAGITGLVHEGYALEEPPISTGEKFGNNNEELRKKILSALLVGRKRLHFSNNKGYINNSVLEGFLTSEQFSDRALGRNEILNLPNEIDVSLSGNVGIGFTPDLINRARFIRLFLDIEDANSREFSTPNLHQWVKDNRSLILSALYSLVKNWFDNGCPKGKIPFSSFPDWASVCGGIMECANYSNPCKTDMTTLSIGGDVETRDMKELFEIVYEIYPEKWITKNDLKKIIKNNEDGLFSYLDFDKKSDQINFGIKVSKFVGRYLSNILLKIKNPSVRASRQEFMFTKNLVVKKREKEATFWANGNVGNVGNVCSPRNLFTQSVQKYRGLQTIPTLPTLPKNEVFWCENCEKPAVKHKNGVPICEECSKLLPPDQNSDTF